MAKITTLAEFITEQQVLKPEATGNLSRLLYDISIAAKIINREINKAGLVDDILGGLDKENIQGEEQKKLDAALRFSTEPVSNQANPLLNTFTLNMSFFKYALLILVISYSFLFDFLIASAIFTT